MNSRLYTESFVAHPSINTAGRDQRAWAKRILYRLDRGATDLLSIQITFAQMAMNVEKQQDQAAK